MAGKVLMMDVDGVLVSGRPSDGRHLFAELEADLGLSPDRLRQTFFTPFWEAIVTGREGLTERLTPVLAEIAPRVSAERLIAYWFENDSRVDQAVLSAVKRYRDRGLPVFLATNQEHLRADYLMRQVGLGAHVDGIIYSAALGHRKPSTEFFERAAAIAAAAPEDIVLVDDTLANVEASRQAGWSAVHWTGNGSLDEELARYLG
ncbi:MULTISPECIES: HAD-IA family hydrolase [unclassified Devosia]|uniref:HAD-IA family hydrolase n=1 Tax=unclassified Devosia TaxID=196773 RepID=UPI00086854A3|nr:MULTISPECIES: HAD-IA family hydrolase [unclassified Devosia]MBN9361858.1 HAD-IA family hydrolase [Devosia sp.]ODS81940.1 MAG: haloacid dehalogenase [Devosia sp. SCN 66-27]OJX26872.1 MAG: haloacid dehalogenase [Devosia sp. 66-14]